MYIPKIRTVMAFLYPYSFDMMRSLVGLSNEIYVILYWPIIDLEKPDHGVFIY